MKNLLHNLDMLEDMPFFESRKMYLTRKYSDLYNIAKFDHPWYWKIRYQKIRDRILKDSIGTSFDDAFSKFCKLVPQHLQYLFLEEFKEYTSYRQDFADYKIDKWGYIREHYIWKKRIHDKPYLFKSYDYKEEWYDPKYDKIIGTYQYLMPARCFEIITQGYSKVFPNRNDPALTIEIKQDRQRSNLAWRAYKPYRYDRHLETMKEEHRARKEKGRNYKKDATFIKILRPFRVEFKALIESKNINISPPYVSFYSKVCDQESPAINEKLLQKLRRKVLKLGFIKQTEGSNLYLLPKYEHNLGEQRIGRSNRQQQNRNG